jgi:hypothetical protein
LSRSWARWPEEQHLEDEELEELVDECGEHGDGTETIEPGNARTVGANIHDNVGVVREV